MICLALLASGADAQSVNLLLANKLAEDADPELSRINLTLADIAPLHAFLQTLSEDYDQRRIRDVPRPTHPESLGSPPAS